MAFKNSPQTEAEYWAEVASLKAFASKMKSDLDAGILSDDTGALWSSIIEAITRGNYLFVEAREKFNLITSDKKVNFGACFSDWSKKMMSLEKLYKNMLCSRCPFSMGFDEIVKTQGAAPCAKNRGPVISSEIHEICPMVDHNFWTNEELRQDILEEHGQQELDWLLKK